MVSGVLYMEINRLYEHIWRNDSIQCSIAKILSLRKLLLASALRLLYLATGVKLYHSCNGNASNAPSALCLNTKYDAFSVTPPSFTP